jgi:glycosyltransferase involved in cell wall biosynthesis
LAWLSQENTHLTSRATSHVSIGIPVYNGGEFLAAAIKSALNQTHERIELLISDNNSSDDTEEICRDYFRTDNRVVYVRQKKNEGANLNYRRVLEMGSGVYFKWLASDDYMAPDFVEKCLLAFEDPTVVIATSHMPYVDAGGAPLPYMEGPTGFLSPDGDIHPWIESPQSLASPRASERFGALLLSATYNAAAQCFYGLIDRKTLGEVRPHGLYVGADKVLMSELLLRGKVHLLRRDLMFRRFHGNNLGSQPIDEYARQLTSGARITSRFVHSKQTAGYAAAISAAPLQWSERARCFAWLARKVMHRSVYLAAESSRSPSQRYEADPPVSSP